ncbi:MAG: flagellar biosynthesis protein FlhA [Planctomycetaceae bacterium]|nr:flagellar biosynthesis protein FlhA [Planctomycetaceae bacterium]
MADLNDTMNGAARVLARYRGLLLPGGAAMMVLVLLVPLPPLLMDVLLSANIALSAIILMTAISVHSPLEFSVFPSVLLGATLLRLVLNIATTRLILTAGAGGADIETARMAAGHVVWSFSQFVTSGSLAVGVILFAIIAVVQFVVITKGAARISEVAARFVLDAMPGKQMAIDADVNAGTIDEAQAHQRRRKIAREADFYGAMDGASKFVRGDAVAAVVIVLVNIGGGLYVGMVQYSWGWEQTLDLFTRLTIGDGLVAQISALLVSVAAALIVSRSMDRTNFAEQVIGQLIARPIALAVTAGFLAALMLTRLPKVPLLLMGAGCAGLALLLSRRRVLPIAGASGISTVSKPAADEKELKGLLAVEAMELDLGFALLSLADKSRDGDLLDRLATLRRDVALELGLIVPAIRIRDDMRLRAHEYVVKIRGARVAGGMLYPGQFLAVAAGATSGQLLGRQTIEPAFGTAAVWIAPDQAAAAEALNYTVIEPVDVLMTHLGQMIRIHAASLLTRQQVAATVESLRGSAEALVKETLARLPLARIHKALQHLLGQGVSVRDLETILEALAERPVEEPIEEACDYIRRQLGPALSQQYCAADGALWCLCLDEKTEQAAAQELGRGGGVLSPALAETLAQAVSAGASRLRVGGHRPVVLCRPMLRKALAGAVATAVPAAVVLGYDEVSGVQVQPVTITEDNYEREEL